MKNKSVKNATNIPNLSLSYFILLAVIFTNCDEC